MRKLNSIAAMASMVLFVIHLIWGAMELFGMIKGGSSVFTALSYTLVVFILLHVAISLKLTFDTVRALRRSGVSYFRENRLFWIRRISGFALMAFLIVHVLIFRGQNVGGMYLLTPFGMAALVSQILMVAALFVHLTTNIRPLKIALGLTDQRNFRTDVLLVLSILLLIAGAAFVVYFLRWMMF